MKYTNFYTLIVCMFFAFAPLHAQIVDDSIDLGDGMFLLSPEIDPQSALLEIKVSAAQWANLISGSGYYDELQNISNNVTNESLTVGENEFTITVTAEDGTTKIYTLTVIHEEQITNVEELFITNLKIYPNPFKGEVRIVGADAMIETRNATSVQIHLQIINAAGAIVHTRLITGNDETVNLEHLPAGVYIFRLEKDVNVRTEMVVRE